jgi:hypothetical protein
MSAERSATASVAYYAGIAGASLALCGVLGIQAGVLQPLTGFYLFGMGALVGGLFTFLLGVVALFTTRKQSSGPGRQRAWIATALGFVLLGAILAGGLPGRGFPPINDISTDLHDPPAFAPASRVPAYAEFDMSYPADFVPIVRAGYPELETIELNLAPDVAYARALAIAHQLGWEISHQDPAAGRFDASDTTRIFRFVDDIAVRVRARNSASEIDIRSRSRVGRGDLGANALRIRAFAAEVQGDPAPTR